LRLTCVLYMFFFQAEDDIRDRNVTGVQTCALPILARYAIEKGVRKENIIIENKAVNTYENLRFSKYLIEKDVSNKGGSEKYNVITVTNNFHVFRALL